jgi:hypothetical protein
LLYTAITIDTVLRGGINMQFVKKIGLWLFAELKRHGDLALKIGRID